MIANIGDRFDRLVVVEELQPIRYQGKNRSYTKRVVLCKCDCGKESIIQVSNLHKTKSCGCVQKEFMRENNYAILNPLIGDKNPNWRGGISDSNKILKNKERLTPKYRDWRKSILERDIVCQKCGTNNKLEAHHINNFSQNKEMAFDIDNGICLCKTCHHSFHKEFGFTDNNMEQMDLYIIS